MEITDEQRIKIKNALALMNSMITGGERHSNKSEELFYGALKILNEIRHIKNYKNICFGDQFAIDNSSIVHTCVGTDDDLIWYCEDEHSEAICIDPYLCTKIKDTFHYNTEEGSKERQETIPLTLNEEERVIEVLNKLVFEIEDEKLIQRFINHYQNLNHYRVMTEGLWATDKFPAIAATKDMFFQLKF